ncbi:MAG TPA: hypothetical protein VFE10_06935 [Phenylobacterium sp.]|jgi:hypothetical protein|nr:hypothetical protein [Phenylobacterium sp.]
MKPLFLVLLAASTLAALPAAAQTASPSVSAIPTPAIFIPGEGPPTLEAVQYFWGGRNYCWYFDGWHGPGWYWCGYRFRRGYGWGGPEGWRGWGHGRGHYHGGGHYGGGHYRGGGGGHGGGFHGGHGGGHGGGHHH